jgi:tetratricopeptide (TPR) repeat protein
VILGTPVANLQLPPLESTHAPGLKTSHLADFATYMKWAAVYQLGDSFGGALHHYQEMIRLDPDFALSYYHLAQVQERLGQIALAKENYSLARDHDTAPLRAPAQAVAIVREIAARENVPLADFEKVFGEFARGGVIGHQLFNDYMHPNATGHRLMAETLAGLIKERRMIEIASERKKP